jgi:isopenicillin N synthase-like dioxygenase
MVVPASRILDFSEAPVVDIGALVAGDEKRIPGVVAAIAAACEQVGFMYVRNHGVDATVVSATVEAAKAFFALPVGQKMQVAIENSPQFRGYLPLEYTGEEGPSGKNLQEAFVVMHERPLDDRALLYGPNQWPAQAPGLRAAMERYFAAMEALAYKMLPGFAAALGLPPTFFEADFRQPMMILKPNHYPPQEITDETEMIGVGGHCDGGGFTILWQDNQGGLEIRNKSGEWVGVPPIEGTFVINIGNMLQRWTNGRFSSTEHRVINRYGADRYSIAFFADPNYFTSISAVVDKTGNDDPPIICGEYLYKNYRRIYPQRTRA